MTGTPDLPRPTTSRWRPLRLGLVDLFHYDDEQFWFHDGRLLLRGNNGTGKSKVLALTLPFLLDGSLSPRRVEPDADPKKRMEWNLLLGGAHPTSERTGYTWLELGRRDADGREHYLTLGCGLKAATGRGMVKHWYFTTSRRVGDLRLVDPASGTVLTQERLRDAIEPTGRGAVYATAEAYRRAVDEHLFGLGETRYGALVDLLVQLRQPQLSKRPDERALSAALTEALPPLDQAVVSDVAESFRSLEEERDGIDQARGTLSSARAFLRHYVDYARIAARRRSTSLRTANSALEQVGRDVRAAEEQLAAVNAQIEVLVAEADAAAEREAALAGQERALRESPEARTATELERVEGDAVAEEGRAVRAEAAAADARARLGTAQAEESAARERYDAAREAADGADGEAAHRAAGAGLADEHPVLLGDEAAARAALARRREQVQHVRGLVRSAERLTAEARDRARDLDTAQTQVARRQGLLAEAEGRAEAEGGRYRSAVVGFLDGLTLLDTGDRDDLADAADDWARAGDGASPVRRAVDDAATAAIEHAAAARAAANRDLADARAELGAVRARIADLESGSEPEPPPYPGRDATVRDGVPGAPLWRLVDFAAEVPGPDRAGLEAALEAAGLLDAWVRPDGSLVDVVAGDVVLGAAGPVAEVSLADVLVPAVAPGDPVAAPVVRSVLTRIGGAEQAGGVWVDADGRWGVGPARGRWQKETAEYVGAGAREAHRRAVVGQLREREAQLVAVEEEARGRADLAERDTQRARAEARAYPAEAEQGVRKALDGATAALRELEDARTQADVARDEAEWAAADAARAEEELTDAAARFRTGTDAAGLDAVQAAVTEYEGSLAVARLRHDAARRERDTLDGATLRVHEAGRALAQAEGEARGLRTHAAELRARADAMRDAVGATVAELEERLRGVLEELDATRVRRSEIAGQHSATTGRRGAVEGRLEFLEERRVEYADRRQATIDALRTFAATGLLRVALPDLAHPDALTPGDWTVTAALGVARSAEVALGDADESPEAWERAQQRVSSAGTDLTSAMSRHGHQASTTVADGVLVARVLYRAEELDVDLLAARLEQDVADRERLLSAHEREILENHLVNDVAGHLSELLLRAQRQIEEMNRELADRKTSTGMQLRVLWRERPDGPAGLSAARDLMTRSGATWTAADRVAIGGFLQARIQELREADPTAGWQEHLERALDYRQWHSFVVERKQHDQWRSASGPASGGERVLAMSVPLFAAAASHYNSANPDAPRFILLDEAFAGVDDDSRAKSLGLLATFDLDVVMTSEREWGCYPQVPGLAIAQLSRVEGVDAVGVTRWQWDGRRRTLATEPEDGARAGVGVGVGAAGPRGAEGVLGARGAGGADDGLFV